MPSGLPFPLARRSVTHGARPPRALIACLSLAVSLLITAPLPGATEAPPRAPGVPAAEVSPTVNPSDRAFLESTAVAHDRGLAFSRLAADQSTHAQIRSLGQMLDAYHTQALATLTAYARARSVALPARTDRQTLEEWRRRDPAAFDEAYLEAVEENHKSLVNLCEEAVQSVDPDIAGFARDQLPTLHDHLSRLRDLRALRK